MARSIRKSLSGGARSAAKKVGSRRTSAAATPASTSTPPDSAQSEAAQSDSARSDSTKGTATKGTAKKGAAKKSTAKKGAAKKSPAKKGAAKKSAAKKSAPAKKGTAKKSAPAKKAAAKKSAPAKQTGGKKPAAGRKAAVSSLVVKADETAWTKAELDEVLDDLHEHRDRLTRWLSQQEEEIAGLMRDSGDGAGADQADVGASSFERDHELTVLNNEREVVAQIDRALARIDDGTYGVCESCGEAIGKNRLMAFPRATLCMSCKQREERR